jgi:hypothetical protein
MQDNVRRNDIDLVMDCAIGASFNYELDQRMTPTCTLVFILA